MNYGGKLTVKELREQMTNTNIQMYYVVLDKGGNDYGILEERRHCSVPSDYDNEVVEMYKLNYGAWEVWI